jgi:hypothetical protein
MRTWKILTLPAILAVALAAVTFALAPSMANQLPQQAGSQSEDQASDSVRVTTLDQAINLLIAREQDEVAALRHFKPIIETYTQEIKADKAKGPVVVKDNYYLGQADLTQEIVDRSMLIRKKSNPNSPNPFSHLNIYVMPEYLPEDFLKMIYIDRDAFDRQHYKFEFVHREFLGEVRCAVFDVSPLLRSGEDRFRGRIWVEDQGYHIVRFNGVYESEAETNRFNPHFDSWRLNLQPGLWLPAYIYSQDSELKDYPRNHVTIKSQTRLWGYNLTNPSHQQEFSDLTIESPTALDPAGKEQRDTSPVEAERQWREQAEINVIDNLQKVGLLAPPGEIDKVLETVVNNLEVTNNLDLQPEIRCRVLLTGTLESFSLSHTIVLSRGLLDVLPDEASLAAMLAQELATIIVTPPQIDRWGFSDEANVPALEAVSRFSFKYSPSDIQAANQKALELLMKSPYKGSLGTAGLFLKQLDAEQKALPALINSRLGNRVVFASQLMSSAPDLQPEKLTQIAALPIGARVKVDPWSDQVEFLKSKPVAPRSAGEKMPFEVTPFMPFLTRYQRRSSAGSAGEPAKPPHP